MKLQSKIRQMFSDELVGLIASLCDTKRIASNAEKMQILVSLLSKYHVDYGCLGGATNRFAVFINGYAVKIAIDTQGYKDNMMEYSITEELQPYVTKSYETNGYILIQQCVRLMTKDEFKARKMDIIKILDVLSQDHLLGDVGYLEKNMENWGITDDGKVVILDYAYCHRATENLFTCEVCGSGILVYDASYDHLMCNNRTVCHARFTYNERKQIQGDQVDLDMIEEAKRNSLVLEKGVTEIEVTSTKDGKLRDGKTIYISNVEEYQKYLKEVNNMVSIQNEVKDEVFETLVKAAKSSPDEAKILLQKMEDEIGNDSPEVEFDEEFRAEMESNNQPYEEEDEEETEGLSLSSIVGKVKGNFHLEPEPEETLPNVNSILDKIRNGKSNEEVNQEEETRNEELENLAENGEMNSSPNDSALAEEVSHGPAIKEETSNEEDEVDIVVDGKEM